MSWLARRGNQTALVDVTSSIAHLASPTDIQVSSQESWSKVLNLIPQGDRQRYRRVSHGISRILHVLTCPRSYQKGLNRC